MSNIDLPKPKPSKLKRTVEKIKSGVKKVGKEYKAGNIPLTIPSMVKNIKNIYRKTQISKPKFSNVQVPVGKPKQTRKPQTLKEQKKPFTRTKRMEGLKRSVIEGVIAARDKKFSFKKHPSTTHRGPNRYPNDSTN